MAPEDPTLADITRRAIHILTRELGPADTARFLRQFPTGSGDYTAERHKLFAGLTVADIADRIRQTVRPAEQPSAPAETGS